MNSILDWALTHDYNNSFDEWKKMELVFLDYYANQNHPIVDMITFDDDLYRNLSAEYYPTKFVGGDPTQNFIGRPESILLMKLRGELLPEFNGFDYSTPLYMVHQIFFYTDMGKTPVYDAQAEAVCREQLEMDHWGENKPYPEILHDWYGECLMALKYMGCELPQDKVDFLMSLDLANITPINYHAYLIKECFEKI